MCHYEDTAQGEKSQWLSLSGTGKERWGTRRQPRNLGCDSQPLWVCFLVCRKLPPQSCCSTATTHKKPRRVLAASGLPRLSQMHRVDTFNLASEVPGFSDGTTSIPEWPFGADQVISNQSTLTPPPTPHHSTYHPLKCLLVCTLSALLH